MDPIFSDEYIQRIHEACEEIELRWYQLVNQIMISDGNWDKMKELAIHTSRSIPPNEYARKTAQRRSYNPQRLRSHDLYSRSKPPIIRRS